MSDKITQDCKIISSTKFMDINNKAQLWAESIDTNPINTRKGSYLLVKNMKYDIKDISNEFIKNVFC